jgi:glycosyltransferase involved in cell wall biosynthesis
LITFFFNDHRIGGPHKQIDRYTSLIKKKESAKFKYITPDFYYNKFLLKFRKYLFFFEIFFITIFIIFNKKKIFNKNKISVVLGIHNIPPIISGYFLSKKTYWYIIEDVNLFSKILFLFIKKIFSPKIIFISNFLKKKLNFGNYVYLPPYIKENKRLKINRRINNIPNVTCVGNINRLKGYDYLIKNMIDHRIDCKLEIIGKKLDTQSNLNNKINELSLKYKNMSNNEIIFSGFKNDNYIKSKLLITDIYILSSISEGSPNALIEAMSYGCICLASNVGGVSNIIKNNNNGFMFNIKNNNFFKIYKKILKLKSSEIYNIKKNAVKTVSNNFANKKYFLNFYKKIFEEQK